MSRNRDSQITSAYSNDGNNANELHRDDIVIIATNNTIIRIDKISSIYEISRNVKKKRKKKKMKKRKENRRKTERVL